MKDQPAYGWKTPSKELFKSVSMNDQYKVYLQAKLKTQSASEWTTVGEVVWSLTGSCAKISGS